MDHGRFLFEDFTPDPDEEGGERPPDTRCTPEKLLAFLRDYQQTTKRLPTLKELKQQFGGILGPIVDFWELQKRGLV